MANMNATELTTRLTIRLTDEQKREVSSALIRPGTYLLILTLDSVAGLKTPAFSHALLSYFCILSNSEALPQGQLTLALPDTNEPIVWEKPLRLTAPAEASATSIVIHAFLHRGNEHGSFDLVTQTQLERMIKPKMPNEG
jgi:hypothetical protein